MVTRIAGAALAVLLSVFALAAPAEVLVLGSLNDNVRKHVKRFTPLSEYLQQELAEVGVTEVLISVLPSSAAMEAALAEGQVDLYFDSPVVAAKVARNSGAVPFLRRWKRGVGTYHSVIVVPTNSEIQSLQDLVGRKIGFQDPDSTSGFLLPMGLILAQQLPAKEIPGYQAPAPEDAIGYLFSKDDKNSILWLSRGWIDAAATDPNGFSKLDAAFPGEYRVVARSIEVPRQTVIRTASMDPTLVVALRNLFVELDKTEDGKAVLKKFHKTSQFDEFPDGVEATFAPIYELLDELAAEGVLGS
ncbi:phosphate/phosphite/phosphonate ABC transporter substrate-binding protein [Tropicimonas sp. TH_r6]|uniref:phosphate/phosphite/phosphonate ABC transporter substrate-binding protein n=1 Tax=Tropicimonas sp. TH_r6 TaxID=3082085 RepID=UPI00295374CA|nr:phosphate/phosphite/phosphonate ABC transporter substrate-binding protein [Tropicimonas sp. TH_r6]MDV7144476.1 phosphate/phosphite/phosphonate ABC transporter substrate-binding protein [Tropicimonas sp. TH_r6]